ncbi:MAG: hypothetical protein KatS3mg110_2154 [Pirellulaceae bacterium]|nr:MAG: hypothetical protein KatS3mg110_2154 [Pirellulaceae bacterium]
MNSNHPCGSDPAQRYLSGQLRQAILQPGFEPSRAGSVPHVDALTPSERAEYIRRGVQLVRSGRVAFSILAAGAASRMDPAELPPQVQHLLKRSGLLQLPAGKALVPVLEHAGTVWTYLDLFLVNVARFLKQLDAAAPVLLFVSSANRDETCRYLAERPYELPEPIWYLEQPLARAFVARLEDARAAERNFPSEEFPQVLEYSRQNAGQYLPCEKPAGHGEFLHQLVASGMAGQLAGRGIRYVAVRNIDNVAALVDERWLAALGYLDLHQADLLAEVSQRPLGQKGGALIRRNERWLLAEDPSFTGSTYSARDSYYINNAVAILDLSLLGKLYETSVEELLRWNDRPLPERTAALQRLAERGRSRFPTLVDPKPFRLPNGRLVAAVVPETNMWESTLADDRVRLLPWAVDSDQDAGADLLSLPQPEQERRILRVRFCPVKTWADYLDPRKQMITHRLARRILDERLVEPPVP